MVQRSRCNYLAALTKGTELTQAELEHLAHWIDGRPHDGMDEFGDVFDPATGQITRQTPLATAADVDAAVTAAARAFQAWRDTSLAKRTATLFRFRELLNERKPELAQLITAEHGKALSDALAEVSRGQEVVEFACGISHLLKGDYSEAVSTRVDSFSIRQPLGPVAIISPFNFPAMVPMWFFPIAIAAGNTVILKPSEKVPSAAIWLAKLWSEAGLPDGVFNVVHGDKNAVDALLTHPDVRAVSFVGSTPVAEYVYKTGTAHGKRVQALGGAKNHMLVLPDADLDSAAGAAINAAYGSAGERCMAISVVVAVNSVADQLIAKIKERAAQLRVGDGRRDPDMGPLVTQAHRDRVASFLDAGVQDGATLVVDGRGSEVDGDANGFWLGPTLFDQVRSDSSIYTEEVFGPVLSVVRVADFDEGLALINANPYGNGTAIFTNNGGLARRFHNEVQVGMVGINIPVPVPVSYHSFGGWNRSLFGDTHAHGAEGVRFYTRNKVVTARWDATAAVSSMHFPQND